MQPSVNNPNEAVPGYAVAVAAEILYVINLLLLPGLSFLVLLVLYMWKRQSAGAFAASHLVQTMSASLWAGVLLVAVNLLILLLGGYGGPWTWVVLVTYFTICHASLVMLGIIGLSKAMAGQCWRYPLVGRPLPNPCPQAGSK